jgi:phosphomannomutase
LPQTVPLINEYVTSLTENAGFISTATPHSWEPVPHQYRFGIDAGNGMTGVVLPIIFERMALNYVPLHFEVDGSFPNHEADPVKEENVADLKRLVIKERLDFGVAFDSDGDRVVFLDSDGDSIPPAAILLLLASEAPKENLTVVHDVTMSRNVQEQIKEWGGKTFVSPVGRTYIRAQMKKEGAALGGEQTGHFYFKEMEYADSALLTMLKIFYIMSKYQRPLDQLVKPFEKYFHSGQINFEIASNDDKQRILAFIQERYANARCIQLDGITIEYDEWRFTVRPSNTEPLLRLTMEAVTKELLEEKLKEVKELFLR